MSSWRSIYAWPLHRLREMTRAHAYTKSQRYTFTYRVKLSVPLPGSVTLAIPLPPETSYQHLSDFQITLPHARESQDTQFQNRFFVTTLHAAAGDMEFSAFQGYVKIDPLTDYRDAAPFAKEEDATPYLHFRDPHIEKLAKHIGAGSCATETATRINGYILDHLTYGDPIDDLYSDLEALTRERVDCGGYDALFVSLCRAHDIPARIVSGFWLSGSEPLGMHAWAEFQDEEGRWIPVDPSVEQLARAGRTKKSGRFGFVGSDRLRLSHGSHIPLLWDHRVFYTPILQHPAVLEGPEHARCRGSLRATLLV